MPWMTYTEVVLIEELLKNLKPKKCLEWGAGYGTLLFPSFINKKASWISIEHNIDWAEKIKKLNKNSNVAIYCVLPNHFPWTDEYEDGNFSDLRDYVEFPAKLAPFDFILVDGRARKDCLEKAYDIIGKEGLVILHDAQREHYREPLKLYKHQIFLQDYAGRAVWIGSKELSINKMFDFDKYIKLDRIFNRINNSCLKALV